jgi:predicted aspartyl protease
MSDILGTGRYSFANGSSELMPKIVIRQIQVGQQTIRNVSATVNPAAADPLLGQSFLARFGTVTIDYRRHVLVLSR